MAEVIITAVVAVFFAIGLYTTAHEIWSLITDANNEENEEKPP